MTSTCWLRASRYPPFVCSWACTLLPHMWRGRRWAIWVQDIGGVERLASTPSKRSLHFTRWELLPGFYSRGYFFMLPYVLKGVNLLSKRRVHAEKPITFRSTRHKSPYEIFVHSGVVPVTRFSYVLLSLWSSFQFCYILLHLFLHSESLLERQGGHLFITLYRLLTPLSYCFLFLI